MTRLFAFTSNNYTEFDYRHKKHVQGPQWTFTDLATRWGITVKQLTYLMLQYPGFPDAGARRKGSTGSNRYYDLHKAQVWFNTHKENIIAFQQKSVL